MLNNLIKPNPYLIYLTDGESNSGWLWRLVRRCLYLWIGSCLLIQSSVSNSIFWMLDALSIIVLPLGVLAFIVLLARFLLLAARLTLTETQKEQFILLLLTNIAPHIILQSLLLAIVYHTRRWLIWIIGGFPFFIWIMCFCYMRLSTVNGLLYCFRSLLNHGYCYADGPTYMTRLMEVFWFLSTTISILSIIAVATIWIVTFMMKSRNAVSYIAAILMLAVPLILVIMLLLAPEGFLLIETTYIWKLVAKQVFGVGIIIATSPFVVLSASPYILRRWVFI